MYNKWVVQRKVKSLTCYNDHIAYHWKNIIVVVTIWTVHITLNLKLASDSYSFGCYYQSDLVYYLKNDNLGFK